MLGLNKKDYFLLNAWRQILNSRNCLPGCLGMQSLAKLASPSLCASPYNFPPPERDGGPRERNNSAWMHRLGWTRRSSKLHAIDVLKVMKLKLLSCLGATNKS
jgi:hypothetical protein